MAVMPCKAITLLSVIALIACCTLSSRTHAANWYVDAQSPSGSPDGQSWATAFATLAPALTAAVNGDAIFVAVGEYAIDTPLPPLRPGVSLVGGFAGNGAGNPCERVQENCPNDEFPVSKLTVRETCISVTGGLFDPSRPVIVVDGFSFELATDVVPTTSVGRYMDIAGCPAIIRNCRLGVITGDQETLVIVVSPGYSAQFENCMFIGVDGSGPGLGIRVQAESVRLKDCDFYKFESSSGSPGVAISANVKTFDADGCGFFSIGSQDNNLVAAVQVNHDQGVIAGRTTKLFNCIFSETTTPAVSIAGASQTWISHTTSTNSLGSFAFSDCDEVSLSHVAIVARGAMADDLVRQPAVALSSVAELILSNCTIRGVEPTTQASGPALAVVSGAGTTIRIHNSIIWDNYATGAVGQQVLATVFDPDTALLEVSHSNCPMQGLPQEVRVASICRDPLFNGSGAGACDGLDTFYEHRLCHLSPCIDSGSNALLLNDAFDVDGDQDTTEPVGQDLSSLADDVFCDPNVPVPSQPRGPMRPGLAAIGHGSLL